jgi:hypothetical protein
MANRINPQVHDPPRSRPRSSCFSQLKHQVSESWHHSQIGHRSEYSVERLLAFHDYYERTSTSRVAAVCMLSPVPALLAALAIDCIPLRSPSESWQANYAVWVRVLLALTIEALGVVIQMRAVLEPDAISISGALRISVSAAACSVLVMLALASLWTFLGYVLIIGPFVLVFFISTVLVVGPQVLIQSVTLRRQLKSQFIIVASQGVVLTCYSIFSAVFNRLSGIQQIAFVSLMPLIKFLTKQTIANAAKSYREYVGPVVVFSVDLFNVYYVSICMQASSSIVTTLLIMATDTFHVLLAIRAIFYHEQSADESGNPQPGRRLRDLLAALQRLPQEAQLRPHARPIRLFAPFPLPLSDTSKALMLELAKAGRFAADTSKNRRCSAASTNLRDCGAGTLQSMPTVVDLKLNQIAPTPVSAWSQRSTPSLGLPAFSSQRPSDATVSSPRSSEELIHDELQRLFHSEYVLLAEYIEFMIPMLYALYLAVLFHLPVAAYYPHTASMSGHKLKQAVTSILIYAAIEFVAFGALVALLKRRFGLSPLYQLAFVLETHAPALQGHLFVWTITILHLTLAHYGTQQADDVQTPLLLGANWCCCRVCRRRLEYSNCIDGVWVTFLLV